MSRRHLHRVAVGLALLAAALPFATHAENLGKCMAGWNATESGDHSGAIALFDACIKEGNLSDASLARTYRNIGIAYRRAKQPLKAIEAYDKAIAMNPADVADDYINRGNAYDEADKFAEAMADYDKALQLKPGYGEIYYNRGITYEHQKDLDKAKAEFLAAYDHGLRTQLLYERFVAYGLAKRPATASTLLAEPSAELRRQLAPPPDGFAWQVYQNCAFLKPAGWNGLSKEDRAQKIPMGAYGISPEPFSFDKDFETGFTVQILVNPQKNAGIPASKAALLYLKPFFEAHQKSDVLLADQSEQGDRHNTIFRYRDAPPGLTPIVVHKYIVADDAADTVHVFTFESPESSWAANWKSFGTPILGKIAIFPAAP